MKKSSSSTRVSLIPMFSSIAKENHKHLSRLTLRMEKLRQESADTRGRPEKLKLEKQIRSIENGLAETSVTVIVFTAMTVESYIYDYAARHLGDTFTKDHLDKLDTLSKWIIIPHLITGKEMSHPENWYGLLKNLIKIRNSIIHHKSSDPWAASRNHRKHLAKLNAESDLIYEAAKQSINLLGILADKISEIDPEESLWVKSYLA